MFTPRGLALALALAGACGVAAWSAEKISLERGDGVVTLRVSGSPVLRYVFGRVPSGEPAPSVEGTCYTHPLYTPSGEVVTDVGPKDHPHHRGVFCAWVKVDGEKPGDWWGWGALAPKENRAIVHRRTVARRRNTAFFLNVWRAEGTDVLEELVEIRASRTPVGNVVDYEYRYYVPRESTGKPVVIAQSPFGGFCYRARPRGELTVTGPRGVMDLPNSVHNKAETNWPAGPWYDFTYRGADGKVNGVAVINHPKNPPTTWHIHRGIHMLNPAITAAGPVTVQPDAPLVLRYRVVVHDGPAVGAELDQLTAEFGS